MSLTAIPVKKRFIFQFEVILLHFIDNLGISITSSSSQRTYSLLHRLEILTNILATHWGSTLLSSVWSLSRTVSSNYISLDCSTKPSSERRDIITVHPSLWVFRSATIWACLARSTTSRMSKASLAASRVEHGQTWPWRSRRRSYHFIDNVKNFLKIIPVFLLYFEHSNKKRRNFFSKLFFDSLKFFQKRIESDLIVFKVINSW